MVVVLVPTLLPRFNPAHHDFRQALTGKS